eukprot:gene21068-27948_t
MLPASKSLSIEGQNASTPPFSASDRSPNSDASLTQRIQSKPPIHPMDPPPNPGPSPNLHSSLNSAPNITSPSQYPWNDPTYRALEESPVSLYGYGGALSAAAGLSPPPAQQTPGQQQRTGLHGADNPGAAQYNQGKVAETEAVRGLLGNKVVQHSRTFPPLQPDLPPPAADRSPPGPTGIWTLRIKKKKEVPKLDTTFEHAKPSFTHQAIAGLVQAGKGTYVCSQNVDCLHLRSGIPRPKIAELHGNCFAERCSICRTEYVRDFQVETVDFKPTGRHCVAPKAAAAGQKSQHNAGSVETVDFKPTGRHCVAPKAAAAGQESQHDAGSIETVDFKPTGRHCVAPKAAAAGQESQHDAGSVCGGALVDNILDWESPLPDDELDASLEHAAGAPLVFTQRPSMTIVGTCSTSAPLSFTNDLSMTIVGTCAQADVALVLGTSLQIVPANEIPLQTVEGGGSMVIVNLQKTPRDGKAKMLVRSRVDPFMALLMDKLKIPVPPYIRRDGVVLRYATTASPSAESASHCGTWGFSLSINSPHGSSHSVPMVEAATLTLTDLAGLVDLPQDVGRSCSIPYTWDLSRVAIPWTTGSVTCCVNLKLSHWADAELQQVQLKYEVQQQVPKQEAGAAGGDGVSYVMSAAAGLVSELNLGGSVGVVGSMQGEQGQEKQQEGDQESEEKEEIKQGLEQGEQEASASKPDLKQEEHEEVRQEACVSRSEPTHTCGVCPLPMGAELHWFVSQRVVWDAAALSEAFKANPPPTKLPQKRARAAVAAEASRSDGEPLRRSGRRRTDVLTVQGGGSDDVDMVTSSEEATSE